MLIVYYFLLIGSFESIYRPPKGHSFLFTQSWVTGGGNSTSMSSTSNQHDIKKSDKNRAHLSFDLGYQLWANSPCNQSRYDPLCLLSLPAETLMASVPTSWLSSDHIWLQPDRFWFQKTAADAWSTGPHITNHFEKANKSKRILNN